jgi:Na+/melibiose symporter-like transporter
MADDAGGSVEEERERYDELLAELRTVIPGAQVLLAFLLTVPFAARFADVDALGKIVFVVALMAIAIAVMLFFAPTAYHRLADRHDRRGRLRYGVRVAVAGMALTGLSIACVVFVVVRFLFDSGVLAIALAGATATLAAAMWFVVPILRRSEEDTPETATRR